MKTSQRKHKVSLLLLLAVFFYACQGDKKEKPLNEIPVKVKVINLGEGSDSTKAIGYSGSVTANKTINLSFQVSGTITKIPVEVGQYVRKGQLIAQIDETIYRNQYQGQQAQATLAKENYERINQVFQKGSIAEIKMLEARSQYEQAQAAVRAARESLSYTSIYAPESGYIGAKLMEAGNTTGPGAPVVQLLDISTVKVNVPVPDVEIDRIKKGDRVNITVPSLGSESYAGTIDEIGISSAQGSPAYSAKVALKNSQNRLKPGMVANIAFNKKSEPGKGADSSARILTAVPLQSLQVDEHGQHFVFVTSADGKRALRKIVETGPLYDNGIGIKSGLKPQEKLIVSGYHKLLDSMLIEIVK